MSAESCLHVSYWNLGIKCGKCSGGRSGGVAMDKYHIGLALLEDITHAIKYANSHICKVLSLLHDVQVNIWLDIEDFQHLVEHFTMLTCYAYDGFKLFCVFLELLHQRAHLDGFWTSAED